MGKESPLKELHQANGAKFAEENGWMLPLEFAGSLRECQAVRSQLGLFDLCDRGLLRFTGPDRVSYLQGMVSNDVKTLREGKGVYAAILDVQGKILADVRIFCAGESFLLDLHASLKEKILAHLNRYLIADEVEISDLTDQYGIVSLQGPQTSALLDELVSQSQIPAEDLDHSMVHIKGADCRLIRCSHTGEEGCDLLAETKDLLPIASLLQETGKKYSLQWVGTQAQNILRIEAGLPRYGVDMDENNLLLETGMDRAVSFQKGCYLGQEVVERVRSRGHVNKKLVGLILEGDTVAGHDDVIRAGEKEVGRITSAVFSPALNRPLALGYVHRDYLQPGTHLSVVHDGKLLPVRVSSPPFTRPHSPNRPLE